MKNATMGTLTTEMAAPTHVGWHGAVMELGDKTKHSVKTVTKPVMMETKITRILVPYFANHRAAVMGWFMSPTKLVTTETHRILMHV